MSPLALLDAARVLPPAERLLRPDEKPRAMPGIRWWVLIPFALAAWALCGLIAWFAIQVVESVR